MILSVSTGWPVRQNSGHEEHDECGDEQRCDQRSPALSPAHSLEDGGHALITPGVNEDSCGYDSSGSNGQAGRRITWSGDPLLSTNGLAT